MSSPMNTNCLHITNGDGAANILKASTVQGDVLPWRDPMHHGPFPANLDLDDIGKVRAEYLAGSTLDVNEVLREFQQRNDHLRTAGQYNEVVLWFEHDLLDQLQILELLDWFSNADLRNTALSLICINSFPGIPNFRGIGELSGEQMASLLPGRASVTQEQLLLARSAWAAFRADDPTRLQELLATDLSALPYLKPALQRHLQEYPWTSDGLTRTERQILTLVSSGVDQPGKVFVENMTLENAFYIGDWPTYRIIESLCNTQPPLLSCKPHDNFVYPPDEHLTPEAFKQQRLSVTDTGRDVLSGKHTARQHIARDFWLGGVHLKSDKSLWLWNESTSRLVQG